MTHNATILELNDHIEEWVRLEINGQQLICFANICPYPIKEGETHPVELNLYTFDEPAIEPINDETPDEIRNIENTFRYKITGQIKGNVLSSMNIKFNNEDLTEEFHLHNGKKISITIDRIDAEFHELPRS